MEYLLFIRLLIVDNILFQMGVNDGSFPTFKKQFASC
jgi:hypothetical protein